MSTLGEETCKHREQIGVDADKLLQNMLGADFYCIMLALADEYGVEWLLEQTTRNCEEIINERTKNNGNTDNML